MAEPAIGKLDVTIGGTRRFRVDVKDEFNTPVNLTGAKLYFTVKTDKGQDDPGELQLVSTTNSTQFVRSDSIGVFDIKLTKANTSLLAEGTYDFDVKVIFADADTQERYPAEGKLRAKTPVTKSS